MRQRASELWAQNPISIDYQLGQQPADQNSGAGGFTQSVPGIGTMYVLFTVLPTAATIVLQRKNGTLPRLAVMPISRAQILGGKLLANFLIGMLEYAIMFTFGFLLGVRYGSDPLAILLLMVTFTLSVTALTLALTTLVHNEGQARGIGLFLTLTLCPLGGAWWPLDIVPEFMRTVGHISPVAWVMDGFRDLLFQGGSLATVSAADPRADRDDGGILCLRREPLQLHGLRTRQEKQRVHVKGLFTPSQRLKKACPVFIAEGLIPRLPILAVH